MNDTKICFCVGGPNCCIKQNQPPLQCPDCGTWFRDEHRCAQSDKLPLIKGPYVPSTPFGACCACNGSCNHIGPHSYCYAHGGNSTTWPHTDWEITSIKYEASTSS